MITTASPSARSRPAVIAIWWPKLRENEMTLKRASLAASIFSCSRDLSFEPSLTNTTSQDSIWAFQTWITSRSLRASSGMTSSSLKMGMTTVRVGRDMTRGLYSEGLRCPNADGPRRCQATHSRA